MTLEQAAELAIAIDRSPRFDLLAIGRFIAPEEMRGTEPWGCSIVDRPSKRRIMVWSKAEWDALIAPPTAKAAAQSDEQFLLF